MIRRPPRSTLFPSRRSSDLLRNRGSLDDGLLPLRAAEPLRPVAVMRQRHEPGRVEDRKSTRLNSSHPSISYAVFCLKKKKNLITYSQHPLNHPTLNSTSIHP